MNEFLKDARIDGHHAFGYYEVGETGSESELLHQCMKLAAEQIAFGHKREAEIGRLFVQMVSAANERHQQAWEAA